MLVTPLPLIRSINISFQPDEKYILELEFSLTLITSTKFLITKGSFYYSYSKLITFILTSFIIVLHNQIVKSESLFQSAIMIFVVISELFFKSKNFYIWLYNSFLEVILESIIGHSSIPVSQMLSSSNNFVVFIE